MVELTDKSYREHLIKQILEHVSAEKFNCLLEEINVHISNKNSAMYMPFEHILTGIKREYRIRNNTLNTGRPSKIKHYFSCIISTSEQQIKDHYLIEAKEKLSRASYYNLLKKLKE